MAVFNKVILVGRLTRDPETRTFANGGKVSKIGFAVTNRKKNGQTGQWEDEPMFIDVEVFNRGDTGKLADLVEERCRKGSQVLVEGKLHLEQWEDKNGGGRRSKHKISADAIQLLDGKSAEGQGGGQQAQGSGRPQGQPQGQGGYGGQPQHTGDDTASGGPDIPF